MVNQQTGKKVSDEKAKHKGNQTKKHGMVRKQASKANKQETKQESK